MTKEDKQSLLAALRKNGPSALADKLEKQPLHIVRQYLADFVKRHNVKG